MAGCDQGWQRSSSSTAEIPPADIKRVCGDHTRRRSDKQPCRRLERSPAALDKAPATIWLGWISFQNSESRCRKPVTKASVKEYYSTSTRSQWSVWRIHSTSSLAEQFSTRRHRHSIRLVTSCRLTVTSYSLCEMTVCIVCWHLTVDWRTLSHVDIVRFCLRATFSLRIKDMIFRQCDVVWFCYEYLQCSFAISQIFSMTH